VAARVGLASVLVANRLGAPVTKSKIAQMNLPGAQMIRVAVM
jgi:hypothetical protein